MVENRVLFSYRKKQPERKEKNCVSAQDGAKPRLITGDYRQRVFQKGL